MPKVSSEQANASSDTDAALRELGQRVEAMSEAERRAMFDRLGPPPTAELEQRLRPFKTPVTERTMRRSVRSS